MQQQYISGSSPLYLKHGEQEVFLSVLVLVPIQGKHDNLEEPVYLTQRHLTSEVCYVLRGGLQEEE